MSYINYNNGAQAGFQNALAMGMSMGAQARQAREEKERKNALSAYVLDPNEANTAAVAPYAPQLVMQQRERQQAQQAEQQLGQLTQQALSDDPTISAPAMQQLAVQNFDRWKTLSTEQKAAIEQEAKRNANAALDVLNLPPQQWSQAIMGYANRYGDPEIAAIADMPIEQQRAALRAAVAEGEMTERLISIERPDYMAVGYDETLVNQRDPNAVAQFGVTANGGQAPANIPPPPPGFTLDGDGAGNSTGGF